MNERIQSLLDYLTHAHDETWETLARLQHEDLDRPLYSSEATNWTVREALAHLADAERGLMGQIRRLLAGQPTVPDDFDLNRWNRSAVRRRSAQTYAQILDDLLQAHLEALAALRQVDPGDLDRVGRHPSGSMLTTEGYFRRMADHRREHTNDIRAAVAAARAGGG